ncbi:MAG: peptide ABC transporter substrate-binding protein [Treponema sp.]|nr:peptide ABC transporter substrate-binding protein [Treponema sp.]
MNRYFCLSRSILATAVFLSILAYPAQGQPAEEKELVLALSSLDLEIHPHHSIYAQEAQILSGLYEGLFSYNHATLEPVRAAARSFNRSRDGKTYTFYLRETARWSNGDRVTAAHFRDAWLRMMDPKVKAEYGSFFDIIAGARDYRSGKTRDASQVGISVIAEDVLQVTLEAPAPWFTKLLCHHSFSPVHPSMLEVRDWTARAAAVPCNGAFRIESAGPKGLTLRKNEAYWDAATVRLPGIRVVAPESPEEASRLFNNGDIQWLAGDVDLESILYRDAIQVNPMFATHYWFFSCRSAPWSNPAVRRALALLAPWDEIRSRQFYLIPATSLVLPVEGYEAPEGIRKPDADRARTLLSEAGFPNGRGLPTLRILLPEGEGAARVVDLFSKAWKEALGLDVVVKTLPASRFYGSLRSADWDLTLNTWIGDFADPLAFLQMWTSDSSLNDAGYSDPEYDRRISESSRLEGEDRFKALSAAEGVLLDSGTVLPIYHSLAVNILDMDILEGWYPNALDIHPFKYMRVGSPKALPNLVLAD